MDTILTSSSDVYYYIEQEFLQLGIKLNSVDMQDSTDQRIPYSVMNITFDCSEKEFPYFESFTVDVKQKQVYIPPPISVIRGHSILAPPTGSESPSYLIRYECRIQLSITGGSIEPFLEEFREKTQELRYAMESKEFDEEVEKMLTTDEYNG